MSNPGPSGDTTSTGYTETLPSGLIKRTSTIPKPRERPCMHVLVDGLKPRGATYLMYWDEEGKPINRQSQSKPAASTHETGTTPPVLEAEPPLVMEVFPNIVGIDTIKGKADIRVRVEETVWNMKNEPPIEVTEPDPKLWDIRPMTEKNGSIKIPGTFVTISFADRRRSPKDSQGEPEQAVAAKDQRPKRKAAEQANERLKCTEELLEPSEIGEELTEEPKKKTHKKKNEK